MPYLVDTNILIRLADTDEPMHQVASDAILSLHGRGEILSVTPQILIEFRAVVTRPVSANGLGLSGPGAEAKVAKFEAMFPLLEDIPAIYPLWKVMVATEGVIGKQVHDARLVAVCHAHQVTYLLTFNKPHFARLSKFGPGVEIVNPSDV